MKATYREVSGTVMKSEVRFDWEFYSVAIEYEYRIDGTIFRGDKVVKGPLLQFNWKGPAQRLADRYPVGAQVTVYVDPADARRAYLQPRIDKGFLLFVLVFLGIATFGVVSFLRGSSVH
jgi:hypothetical protein